MSHAAAQPAVLLSLLLVLSLPVAGCSKHADSSRAAEPAPAGVVGAPGVAAGGGAGFAAVQADRAMRITVETTVLVKHRDLAVAQLREGLSACHGYVSQGSLSGADEGGSATFELKVPAGAVGSFRSRLAALGEVTSDSEKAEDVTEARADLAARLSNARAEESRLLALLEQKTGNLADVMSVEKEIASVREGIERFEAEQRVMEGQIAMATFKVRVDTVYVAQNPSALDTLGHAAKDGIETGWAVLLGTVSCVLAAGPTVILLGGLVFSVYVLIRAVRRRIQRARLVSSFGG